ncbi:MAG: PEGA domain-containing protein [Desulfobacterales bacterium]|nr:PEGA domain-containing protein [Desulfobacterales bacterium]
MDVEGCDRLQELTLGLAPNWSGVAVSSIPSGAAVKVDGRPLGKTPVEVGACGGERTRSRSAPTAIKPGGSASKSRPASPSRFPKSAWSRPTAGWRSAPGRRGRACSSAAVMSA